jgi:hypothetical protein
MEKYAILIGYFDKQLNLIHRLYDAIKDIDVKKYEQRYVFAMKTQQLYTAIEDLLKQIAKAFENHIEDLSSYHRGLLIRLNTEIPKIRPAVINADTLRLLDKIRAFRHFIRHAYDCELDERELSIIQKRFQEDFHFFNEDITTFRKYVQDLAND